MMSLPLPRPSALALAMLMLLTVHAHAQRSDTGAAAVAPQAGAQGARLLKLIPHRVSLSGGRSFSLNLPEGFAVSVAAEGLRRVRFMSKSPDGRIFVTDMYNLTDNKRARSTYLTGSTRPLRVSRR